MDASSVEAFRAKLGELQHSLIEWFATQPSAEGWVGTAGSLSLPAQDLMLFYYVIVIYF